MKRRYARTNRRNFIPQLVKKDVIENVHERMAEELEVVFAEGIDEHHAGSETERDAETNAEHKERQQVADEGRMHHRIAADESVRIHLGTWLHQPEIQNDPAYKVRAMVHSHQCKDVTVQCFS